MAHQLLIVHEPRAECGDALRAALAPDPLFRCEHTTWSSLRDRAPACAPDVVVAVACGSADEALDGLRWWSTRRIAVPTLAVLPATSDEQLFREASRVADDFVTEPLRVDELRRRLARLIGGHRQDVTSVQERLTAEMGLGQLVGSDPAFVEVLAQIPAIARSEAPVLVAGETGTGKELIARAIHHLGRRAAHPFIAVDCGAVPDQLFENELFGHVRGAFTDAQRDQKGLVALANGGTLLLDEIDGLSLAAQGKLLRFLQERTFRPLGAERFAHADVNVIAASNGDLERCVAERQFRADLYYRLNVIRLRLPALRERRGDIETLARHFLRVVRRPGDAPRTLARAALEKLLRYDWPGNVRELSNVIQRAAIFAEDRQILPSDLAVPDASPDAENETSFRSARAAVVAAFEHRYLAALLSKYHGNVTRAAREAKQERRAFGRLIKKHGIDRRRVGG